MNLFLYSVFFHPTQLKKMGAIRDPRMFPPESSKRSDTEWSGENKKKIKKRARERSVLSPKLRTWSPAVRAVRRSCRLDQKMTTIFNREPFVFFLLSKKGGQLCNASIYIYIYFFVWLVFMTISAGENIHSDDGLPSRAEPCIYLYSRKPERKI